MANKSRKLQHSLDFTVQFVHPEKVLGPMPGLCDDTIAALLGVPATTYTQLRAGFADRAREAAEALLSDEGFASQVDALPFASGATIVGVGDSITDDLQSWFEILRHLLAQRHGEKAFTLINAGVSGDTTSKLIERFLGVVEAKPDWVLLLAGTNDVRLHGKRPTKILVSADETEQNLRMLRAFGATQTRARWIWITPPPVIETKVAAYWGRAEFQMVWRNSDLSAVAQIMQRLSIQRPGDVLVDLQATFGRYPKEDLLMFDGLHPTLEGHKAIVRALVEQLATMPA